MKSHLRAFCGVLVLGASGLMFSGCGDDDDDRLAATPGAGGEPSATDGSAECAVIGELCHEADSGSGAGHECHNVGHEADGAACLAAFAGCVSTCVGDDDDGSGSDPHCAALGELCHAVDDHDGPLHACHELGHENDAEQCAAAFDDCSAQCLAAREALEEAPAAGAGGRGAGGVSTADFGGGGGAVAAGGVGGAG
jgi:hypothetical protein